MLPSRNNDEFFNNIKRALRLKDNTEIKGKCYKCASENNWDQRVDVIENAINDYCNKQNIILGEG